MPRSLPVYDMTVPHPPADPVLADDFTALRRERADVDLATARDVVLLVSSSRGGSSMLTELLRRSPDVLTLPGELNPHVVVGQISGDDGDVVAQELARDIGAPAAVGDVDPERLARDVRWRLLAQWPRLDLAPDEVTDAVRRAAEAIDPAGDVNGFTLAVLRSLSRRHPELETSAYDLGAGRANPSPPQEPVVEMTPYVAFRAWRGATTEELRAKPVVIATPRNSFRLDWLVELFPRARVRVLHLTRNPAASVNGLVDGWRSASFFTVPVDVELRIDGYSDSGPLGRRWWKYDVPPCWRDLVDADLATVAAEQWRSAHAATLEFVHRTAIETLRVRYEDMVGDTVARAAAAEAVADFLGIDREALRRDVIRGIEPVMATAPPQRRRWSSSTNDIAPALAEPAVWEVAAALGYEVEERLWI